MGGSGGFKAIGVFLVSLFFSNAAANADEQISQYKAAMTKVFLEKYAAFPIFIKNPLFPGDVVAINNEELVARGCYKKIAGGNYKGTQDFSEGIDVSSDIDARIGGVVIKKRIADADVGADVTFAETARLSVSPLSLDSAPDANALLDWDRTQSKCHIIDQILAGEPTGLFLVSEVLHGKVNFSFSVSFSSSISAKAKSDLLLKIARSFSIDEATIGASISSAVFGVSTSPDNMTLAIRPARYNREELARITLFMRGERGAKLEIAVESAIRERDIGIFEKLRIFTQELMGDEIKNRTDWARRMAYGKEMVSLQQLSGEEIDMQKVATYAAAMVIVGE
ncbi:hypothetical protein [Rhizobium sp. CNPSo 3490]|uniref:hypothetical protein n=1 Tax=Rhizobium sp. CNPSo 3490 TaxID=3021407 RepID=UPI00254E03D6|nr:hypothetical protein [Rhizobium sp. CNPSo 3490]MDK4737223.1 hypothetical protein [Rhizobium sp. CNPSo 3490]